MSLRSPRALVAVAVAAVIVLVAAVVLLGRDDAEAEQIPLGALPEETSMGAVELRTGDPQALRDYYVDGVGLSVLGESADEVVLGSGTRELLRLVDHDAPDDDPAEAGLYHSAFLFPDQNELADALVRTVRAHPSSFQGSSDHRVSQAFYLTDPDGNGVELYVDTPREDWEWSDGQVTMGSNPLDPQGFVSEHATSTGPSPVAEDVLMGHVHLRVGDLGEAEDFYADALGMAVTSRTQGAVFLAAGGYHHHLAANTWSSGGAGERPDSLGLGAVSVVVPEAGDLDAVERRLSDAGHEIRREPTMLHAVDPWGTAVVVRAAAA